MDIASLRDQTQGLSSKRNQESEEALAFGLICMDRFEADGFTDPELIKEACRNFIQSIRLNSRDERPHIALAHLFLLIDDQATSMMYIASAQAINPDHPMLKVIQAGLREARKMEKEAEAEMMTAAKAMDAAREGELDYDELYDQVESYIQELVHKLSTQQQPQATVDPKGYKVLSGLVQSILKRYDKIIEDIKLIEEEIDADELRNALQPIEMSVKRLRSNLNLSKELLALHKEIKETKESTEQATEDAEQCAESGDLPLLEENVEILLDHCDNFADRLEQYEKHPAELEPLLTNYEKLVDSVEKFRDAVDDAVDRIQGG